MTLADFIAWLVITGIAIPLIARHWPK